MRLALADVPKRFSRREGVVGVAPRLLRPRASRGALTALIGLYEGSLGIARADFPDDRAAQIAADVRLARCLTACLGEWYQWASAPWPKPAMPDEVSALAQRGIDGPAALRLALYDHVNTAHGGFLGATAREPALDAFAASLGLARATLDALLAQDDPRAARLIRLSDAAPAANELAARYNQRAVEALLASASEVTWRIEPREGASLGGIVKRVCFLARQMGVSYEVAFDDAGQLDTLTVAEREGLYAVPTTLDRARLPVIVTLHGPREVMGAANQYGDRLARLCRALLGYRRDIPTEAALGAVEGLSGDATIHIHGRPCQFTLDEGLARLLRVESAAGEDATRQYPTDSITFDSTLERRLHADFAALERAGETAGWRLEREPEPVILGDTILVPDFALTRENRRVYLEVAGYWRPEYRARKARKLALLRGVVALIVAAPEEARAEFANLDASYPFIWYRGDAISAPALVAAIERAYDDFPERLATLDLPRLLVEVQRRGRIPPAEATAALRAYTRAEVARATQALSDYAAIQSVPAPEWLDDLGLCAPSLLDRLAAQAHARVLEAGGRLALSALAGLLAGENAPLSEAAAEALARRGGLRIERASLFAAEAVAPGHAAPQPMNSGDQPAPATREIAPKPQPRKAAPRTHSGAGWSAETLFPADPPSAGDGPKPDATPPPSSGEVRRHTH
jgi:predicted nuclease of restriction endonuclease-like RecB superfamily